MSNFSVALNNVEENIDFLVPKFQTDLDLKTVSFDMTKSDVIILKMNISSENVPIFFDIIADYIIKYYQTSLLIRLINLHYCYFTSDEKNKILDIAQNLLQNTENNLSHFLYNRNKNLIIEDLKKYCENNSDIFVEGIVNFRLKSYITELEDIVDKSVDSFLASSEYKEFIELLKYVVSVQPPTFDSVHIHRGRNGKYSIYDNNKNDITSECLQDFLTELPFQDSNINYDDLLLSSLISLAPNKIYLHSLNNIMTAELLNTIKSVFQSKIIIYE